MAATFSSELIGRWIDFWVQQCGLRASCAFADYAQLERELRAPLTFRTAASCVGLLRWSDWQRGEARDGIRRDTSPAGHKVVSLAQPHGV